MQLHYVGKIFWTKFGQNQNLASSKNIRSPTAMTIHTVHYTAKKLLTKNVGITLRFHFAQ